MSTETKPKHTHTEKDGWYIRYNGELYDEKGTAIADVFHAENHAIIAAAPDLLEACKTMGAVLTSQRGRLRDEQAAARSAAKKEEIEAKIAPISAALTIAGKAVSRAEGRA